jgi:hypothetical protein
MEEVASRIPPLHGAIHFKTLSDFPGPAQPIELIEKLC